MSKIWQHPFVNIFKHYHIEEWKKSSKEGEVISVMDKTLKCTVYRITGSIPAGNYIQLPQTSTQSLGLTGRYLYLLFRPAGGKYFVVHLDVVTDDDLVVRISFSNLFKEFKSSSTWLQLPFVCNAGKDSIDHYTAPADKQVRHGPAPNTTKWTVLVLDFQYILSMYLNRKYAYLKNIRLCANLAVKNMFTSDMQYEPGITLKKAKDAGLLAHGVAPIPRDMMFHVPKGQNWYDLYDYIRFPVSASKVPFDSIQVAASTRIASSPQKQPPPLGTLSPQRVESKQVHVDKKTDERVTQMDNLTKPKKERKRRPKVTAQLPTVNLSSKDPSVHVGEQGEVHVFAKDQDNVTLHRHDAASGLVSTLSHLHRHDAVSGLVSTLSHLHRHDAVSGLVSTLSHLHRHDAASGLVGTLCHLHRHDAASGLVSTLSHLHRHDAVSGLVSTLSHLHRHDAASGLVGTLCHLHRHDAASGLVSTLSHLHRHDAVSGLVSTLSHLHRHNTVSGLVSTLSHLIGIMLYQDWRVHYLICIGMMLYQDWRVHYLIYIGMMLYQDWHDAVSGLVSTLSHLHRHDTASGLVGTLCHLHRHNAASGLVSTLSHLHRHNAVSGLVSILSHLHRHNAASGLVSTLSHLHRHDVAPGLVSILSHLHRHDAVSGLVSILSHLHRHDAVSGLVSTLSHLHRHDAVSGLVSTLSHLHRHDAVSGLVSTLSHLHRHDAVSGLVSTLSHLHRHDAASGLLSTLSHLHRHDAVSGLVSILSHLHRHDAVSGLVSTLSHLHRHDAVSGLVSILSHLHRHDAASGLVSTLSHLHRHDAVSGLVSTLSHLHRHDAVSGLVGTLSHLHRHDAVSGLVSTLSHLYRHDAVSGLVSTLSHLHRHDAVSGLVSTLSHLHRHDAASGLVGTLCHLHRHDAASGLVSTLSHLHRHDAVSGLVSTLSHLHRHDAASGLVGTLCHLHRHDAASGLVSTLSHLHRHDAVSGLVSTLSHLHRHNTVSGLVSTLSHLIGIMLYQDCRVHYLICIGMMLYQDWRVHYLIYIGMMLYQDWHDAVSGLVGTLSHLHRHDAVSGLVGTLSHLHRHDAVSGLSTSTKVVSSASPVSKQFNKTLKPDPILALRRIVGFGGYSTTEAIWSKDGTHIIYPCHAVVVSMDASNGVQRFFIGHTDKISSLSLNGNGQLLASGQTGRLSVVRVWNFHSGQCLAMFKTHVHSLFALSFSVSGRTLCGVGKDGHGKNMIVVWNTSKLKRNGDVEVLAKAHTDVDIVRVRIAPFDDMRLATCGRDNVRLWRVRNGQLRSAPVSLGDYNVAEFTDICFETTHHPSRDPADRLILACTRSGHIFEIDHARVSVAHVRRLLPVVKSKEDKSTFRSGSGIPLNCMYVNDTFCATGSDDGMLRLWPLDFSSVYLEAEHEGPVTAVSISSNGLRILAGTATGNIGVLDVSTRSYTTLMRSHTDQVLSFAFDPLHRNIATVSHDHTIRVWDVQTLQQLYDFSTPQECPCAIKYHPSLQCFACGFDSGCVRVFNIASTSLVAEYREHRGKVTGLVYSPNAMYLYSCCSMGSIALYDASQEGYQVMRLLGNAVAKGNQYGPDMLSVSEDSKYVAYVGPSEFTVTVADGKSLDEMLRIDITSMGPEIDQAIIDTAVCVHFSPLKACQLLVMTSTNRLLRLDSRSGRLMNEISHIHRSGCSSIDVISNCRHLATAGDKVIKIWDYHMRLDINFQVFIGHSEDIKKLMFSPDALSLISVGEAIFVWDFFGYGREASPKEGRTPTKNLLPQSVDAGSISFQSPVRRSLNLGNSLVPRKGAPKPTKPDKLDDFSAMHMIENTEESDTGQSVEVLFGAELESRTEEEFSRTENEDLIAETLGHSRISKHPTTTEDEDDLVLVCLESKEKKKMKNNVVKDARPRPDVTVLKMEKLPPAHRHFIRRENDSVLAQRRYIAPPNQAGLKLKSVIGYNGNGRGNMVWQADTGLFAYTSGCVVILEDLNTGSQRHLIGHVSEISTLALQNDSQLLASASGASGLTSSQICLWDVQGAVCKKVLSYHEYDIVCLAFSRDDRFLLSVGDYRERAIVIWNMMDYSVITASKTALPVHAVQWDPYATNEFATVGEKSTMLFWLLDETQERYNLNVHEATIPEELLTSRQKVHSDVSLTSLHYGGDSVLFVGTSTGVLSAWDTRHNTCFMHWEAETSEIGVLVCRFGSSRLITGGCSRNLRLWSVYGVGELRLDANNFPNQPPGKGLVMEDEMPLDGAIVSASFDDTMDIGVVGTDGGTLWYINWVERSCVRLVSTHSQKVTDIAFGCQDLFATSSQDGSIRVWSMSEMEQTIQFQIQDQSCNCITFNDQPCESTQKATLPKLMAGYSDGTLRVFDLAKVELVLKMHPHAVAVTAIATSADGRVILSGGQDGLIAVSSPATGMTVRVINDHKGAPITDIKVNIKKDADDIGFRTPLLWMAASADRRVSVWTADWSSDKCEMVDWLSFPAPAFAPDGTIINKGETNEYDLLPPSLVQFSSVDPDTVIYTGYGMQKQIQFYSLNQKKSARRTAITHWPTSMDVSPAGHVIATGSTERLVKLMDYHEGSFQDFIGHNDAVQLVAFTPSGKLLFSVAFNEIFVWEVKV
ncbi:WD repeat-containing protein 90-like [Antedon mediterranea]|uniref:WD repeat-containing protein 90-like n=1 Tax=Antedon mediterranea TaxID=105859 RepID=UPI003AF52BFA